MKEKTPSEYKDVVVVGNGPSGLFMSYLLSGRCPMYNGRPHPETMLNTALQCLDSKCLYEADLTSLASSADNTVGALMDKLLRPGAEIGLESDPLVDFRCFKSINHVVIGKGPPGGIWNTIPDTYTLSLSNWMELPGLKFDSKPKRVRASTVAKYFQRYVRRMNLNKYMRKGTVVNIEPVDSLDPKVNYKVEVVSKNNRYIIATRCVVLASGTYDVPNRLNVEGENLPWVYHNLKTFEADRSAKKVLIVGGGLSAADAVISCRLRSFGIEHVFRHSKNPNLHSSVYPDYCQIYEMMNGAVNECPEYHPYSGSSVISFREKDNKKIVTIKSLSGKMETLEVDAAVILIGSSADLRYTEKNLGQVDTRNPIDYNVSTSEIHDLPNCFVVGSLAGENFVRNITGAAIMAAARIYKNLE